jgi:hypothetical protein
MNREFAALSPRPETLNSAVPPITHPPYRPAIMRVPVIVNNGGGVSGGLAVLFSAGRRAGHALSLYNIDERSVAPLHLLAIISTGA